MRCTALALLFGRAVKRASRMVLKCAGEEDGLRSASLANTFDLLIDRRVSALISASPCMAGPF
jgi:hypothetical protein